MQGGTALGIAIRVQTGTGERPAVIGQVVPPSFISYGLCFSLPPFPRREILFTQVDPSGEPRGPQSFHVLVHLRVGDMRVNLRGGNGGVPHHAADRFYRHAERERDMGTEIMPCLVEGQVKAVGPSQFLCQRDEISAGVNVEYLVPGSSGTVLLDDPKGDIQQADGRGRAGFLPADMDPPRAVAVLRDILVREPSQIRVCQSGKGREDEHVPHELQLRLLHRCRHQRLQVFQSHVAALPLGQFRMQAAVRIAAQCPLAYRPHREPLQPVQVLVHRLGLQLAVRAEEYLEVVIEYPVKASQRHVFHALPFMYECRKMLVGAHVGVVCLLYAVYPDTFFELFVMFPEKGQQGERLLAGALEGVLHQLRRDEAQAVPYPVVMPGYLPREVVYGTVHDGRILAASVGASLFRIPDGGIDGHFRSDLFAFRINAHLAQQLARPVLACFRAVDIEQYRKCAAAPDVPVV